MVNGMIDPMYIKDSMGSIAKMGFLWWKFKGVKKKIRLYKIFRSKYNIF